MVTSPGISHRKCCGFTLLELLVVLTIAGMLVALVPPVISAVIPGTKAKVAARDLAATLRDARNLAISQSTTIDLRFDTDARTYAIAGGKLEKLPRGTAVTILGEDGRTRPKAFDGEPYTLRFYADGSSNGIRTRLGSEDSGYIVTVGWLMGRVVLSEARAGAQ